MVQNIFQLLERAAESQNNKGLSFYLCDALDQVGRTIGYNDLFRDAKQNARAIRILPGASPSTVILLHFDDHVNNIEWLWAVVAAGLLPVVSTPMVNDLESRKRHLGHLENVLDHPIVLTTEALRSDFDSINTLNVQTIEDARACLKHDDRTSKDKYHSSAALSAQNAEIDLDTEQRQAAQYGFDKRPEDPAVLMLTSGSSGNAKAVVLSHEQILHAVEGKSRFHKTRSTDVFLNWINLDHVANLTESHLHAMSLSADQIHVQASHLLPQPEAFLDLVNRHRVSHSFAPNFFLASLRRALESPRSKYNKKWDLTCLRACISGGEANVTETTRALSELLSAYGAPENLIRPGFGMTETCAGCIYNTQCPQIDIENCREFGSLGTCIPGLNMRIKLDDSTLADPSQVGSLQLSGAMVFNEYRNNPIATQEAFTEDGWFVTGDLAMIDDKGHLVLAGRSKETIIVNGVKHFPHELETAIEEAEIPGLVPSYTAVFPHRPKGSDTEGLVVIYLPSYNRDDIEARVVTSNQIAQVSVMQTNARPHAIIPLEENLLPKSTLGKLSRPKLRAAFECGTYDAIKANDQDSIRAYRTERIEAPSDDVEEAVLGCFVSLSNVPFEEVGLSTSLFDWGVSSIEIIKLKTIIQKVLALEHEIPVITIMRNPTIKGLASAVKNLKKPHQYNPIVTLQSSGSKTPIFLVHPGVGEVLVFLNLAKYITDRPVHAIRARGFDGEPYFKDIPEVIETYYDAIKKNQPEGPYLLAGYSYGSMLAFEISKKLESNGDDVGFLGVLNLPPHIKLRVRQLDFVEVLLNLSYFLGLITEDFAREVSPEMHKMTNSDVLDFIVFKAPSSRMYETALDKVKLQRWADLAYAMQQIAQDYDPSGSVDRMDVFYAIPLSAVAKSEEDWMVNHLSKWRDFVRSDVRFTEVDGAHYTMIGPDNVLSFSKKFRQALANRGL